MIKWSSDFTWYTINSAINHYSPRLNPIPFNKFRLPNSNNQNIRSFALKLQILITIKLCVLLPTQIITISFKSFVFEWHTVTVAWCHLSNSAAGVPTILLLPKTTASAPLILMPDFFINSITPLGVHGRNPVMFPTATRPSLNVFNLEN